VFVAVFQPVQTILVAVMAALILGDQLYSGGYALNLLIICGIFVPINFTFINKIVRSTEFPN